AFPAALDIDKQAFESVIKVPIVPGQMLEVADELASVRVDGQRRIGIEVRARTGPACEFGVWNWGRGAPKDQIKFRIVATGAPERTALAFRERHAVPGG